MYDVLIIGGGLAGLSSALHLATKGVKVAVLEKKTYPFHKFCGEYLSLEVLPYLQNLGVQIGELHAGQIGRFLFGAPSGKQIETRLPLGGLSLTRHRLDAHLFQLAEHAGIDIFQGTTAEQIHFANEHFLIHSKDRQSFVARTVVGSYGKRTVLDKQLKRRFFFQRSPYLGVKYYVKVDFPSDAVALFNFPGGYCGAVRVENGVANFTYLTRQQHLKTYGRLPDMEAALLMSNPLLRPVFEQIRLQQVSPFVISNISFQPKELVHHHVLMCGDAAGMIAPVCGNGMAMAIHSAKLVSETLLDFLGGKLDRSQMESSYQEQWKALFASRLFWGRQLQKFMGKRLISEGAVASLRLMPGIFPSIIRLTHGAPIL